MDGRRFDQMTKAMANGATRRRALRLAGGGLGGALLAAAGLGRRAGAQPGPPEGFDPHCPCATRACPRDFFCLQFGSTPGGRQGCSCQPCPPGFGVKAGQCVPL
jgi:hypothetical protein